MTKLLRVSFAFLLLCIPIAISAQDRVTLFSINKHRGEKRVFCLNFRTGPAGYSSEPCDLRYGSLYIGEEMDWLESSGAQDQRSVIKDLGIVNWDQGFSIPVVEPRRKLAPGEQRQITIDASGADGADGTDGASGRGRDGGTITRSRILPTIEHTTVQRPRPKNDGKPKVDSMFVKAVVGHTYVIRVVNETEDFYVAFQIEAIERGSSCTISWRMIEDPAATPAGGK